MSQQILWRPTADSEPADEPTPFESALKGLGITHSRLEILRILASRSETSIAQLIAETGLSVNGARAHLLVLKRCGIVSARHTTHPRGAGPITYWRVDLGLVEDLVESVRGYLLGSFA